MRLLDTLVLGGALATVVSGFLVGWVLNIVTLLSGADMAAGEIVVRAIGVIVPLIGAIAGYF